MAPHTLTNKQLDYLLSAQNIIGNQLAAETDPHLLQVLTSLDREHLNQLMTEERYGPGEIVFLEGQPGDATCLIWAGRVAVVKGEFDSPTILGYRGPGEIVGEMALLEDQPRSASIVALENLRLLRINRENFQKWLSSNPAVAMSVMASLSSRLRVSDNVRDANTLFGRHLMQQVSELETEQQQLIEMNRIRQETADLIVHDLRNPLSIIQGALNMLSLVLPEDVLHDNRDLVDLATAACERMRRLVDSLLDVSRMEAGQAQFNFTKIDLHSMLEEVSRYALLAVKSREIAFEVAVADDLPPVPVDVEKIERVLVNLMDNAIKYTPQRGQITLTAAVEGDYILLSVADNGPGIPAAERARIFERFAQVPGEKPLSGRHGFGLGLTFCKLVVEAHGGQIWVEPGEGGIGSRFAFTLPWRTG